MLRKAAFIIFLLVVFFCNDLNAQAPPIQWQKCLGGSNNEGFGSVSSQQTTDGGYIVAGNPLSNDGDVSGNHGEKDCWVVKLDAAGSLQWQKCLGGSRDDIAYSIQQTSDGGYIVAGNTYTYSNDGDVSGHHESSYYNSDGWVVKLDASGNIQWQKCLGGSGDDWALSIQQTTDGGYIVAGFTYSNDGDVSGIHASPFNSSDCWVVKLNASGNIQWQKCLGGSDGDVAWSIQQTTDGGYIVAGSTASNNGDVSGHHGPLATDYWVVKLDAAGNIQWQKCLGGTGADNVYSIQQTTDGGYVVSGTTFSNDGDVSGYHASPFNQADAWVVKLDAAGNIQWQRCLGGSQSDYGDDIRQTSDGGYILSGGASSNDGDVGGNHLGKCWVVKLNAAGNIQWQKCIGGSGIEEALSIRQTTDGGYIVAGWTTSNDGDVNGNHGGFDYWVVKLSGCAMAQPGPITGNINGYCSGSSQNYSIAPVTGATGYTWTVANGWTISSGQGTTSVTVTTGTSGGNIIVTVNYSCGSITQTLAVAGASPMVLPQVSILSNTGNTVCAGSSVTFTATPTNGGTNPSYQWKVNGINAGTNSPTYTTNALTNGQVVNCTMTTNLSCANPNTVVSNNITASITPTVTPTISIRQESCTGNSTRFYATITNGGVNPSYLWSFTGSGSATNFNSSAFTLNNVSVNTQVQCSLNSDANCANPATVTSLSLTATCPGGGVVSPANLDFQVYPNPSFQNTLITFYLGQSIKVAVEVFNILGQKVAIITDRIWNSGNQIIPWNPEMMASGVYFVCLRTVNYRIAKKLVVLH